MSSSRKTSVMWNHFTDIGGFRAICNICNVQMSYKSSVSNLKKHLKRKHPTVSIGRADSVADDSSADQNDVTEPIDHEEEMNGVFIIEQITSPDPVDTKNSTEASDRTTAQNRTTRQRLSPPKIKIASQQMSDSKHFNNFNNVINRTTNDDVKDECDIFGKFIAKKLKRLPDLEREDLMFEIHALFQRSRHV